MIRVIAIRKMTIKKFFKIFIQIVQYFLHEISLSVNNYTYYLTELLLFFHANIHNFIYYYLLSSSKNGVTAPWFTDAEAPFFLLHGLTSFSYMLL